MPGNPKEVQGAPVSGRLQKAREHACYSEVALVQVGEPTSSLLAAFSEEAHWDPRLLTLGSFRCGDISCLDIHHLLCALALLPAFLSCFCLPAQERALEAM